MIFGKRKKQDDMLLNAISSLVVEIGTLKAEVETLNKMLENSPYTQSEEDASAERRFWDQLQDFMNFQTGGNG